MQSSAGFSLPRLTSVRRPRAKHSTIDTERVQRRIPPSRDCSQYTSQSVPTRARREPSDHKTRVAKKVYRSAQGADSPLAPSSPLAIEVGDWPVVAAGATRERGWPLRRKHTNRSVPVRNRSEASPPSGLPVLDAARTLVPGEWCPDSDPSIRRLCLLRVCLPAGIALAASFRADATSQITKRLPDKYAAASFSIHSCKRSAPIASILSRGARLPALAGRRRTEVRRGKLKLAPRACATNLKLGLRLRLVHG